ncbi:MAG: 2-oxo acid dehydrogenase subunit E2 [Actinomycetota bacterium]|nr:2-oxo acid dehydrogenase subunit E2 [Actinomycetota bacterium]
MAAKDFLLPDLGEGLEEAEVVTWRVSEGDRVELNQPLVEVNTAKALVEIPSPFGGVVAKLHAAEGDVVKVGAPLVTIEVEEAGGSAGSAGAAPAATPAKEAPTPDAPKRRPVLVGYGVAEEEPEPRPAAAGRRREGTGPVPASPPVRRLAKDLGVDLAAVPGTGPGGRVTREDVEKAAGAATAGAEAAAPGGEAERIPVRGTRRLIAEHMARSAREIPHVTTFLTVDAHWLEEFRRDVAGGSDARISPLPVIVRALTEVVREHPKLNASFDAERSEMVLYRDCHVGIASDTDAGLLVPVVRDAGRKSILEIAAEIGSLSQAARKGTIGPDRMAGGTITVTNVGTFGSEFGTPIINFPQAAILAVGVIEPRALVVDGEVAVRPAMTLSLSFDHRLLDGAEAGRALRDLGQFLESPFRLGSLPR